MTLMYLTSALTKQFVALFCEKIMEAFNPERFYRPIPQPKPKLKKDDDIKSDVKNNDKPETIKPK